jgi:hypothetical protein
MSKRSKVMVTTTALLLLITLSLITYSISLKEELMDKDVQIAHLNDRLNEEQKKLYNRQKPSLVTALGVSVEPRNDTPYPHPHFTFDGYVFNVGNRTAFNARLEISAFYKKGGYSAFNMTIPLGDLGRYQLVQVSKVIATSDWIGNFTIIPLCEDES